MPSSNPLPHRFCTRPFVLLCCLMALLLLYASSAAFAGTWTLARTSSSTSQTVNGVTTAGSYPPQKGTSGPSITLPAFSPAAPASNVPGTTEACSGTLTVTVTGTWNPAGANDPVPNTIVSVQTQAGSSGSTGQPLSQTSDDGYQDPTGGASSSGTHYKLETSSPFTISLTLTASVSATATANATAMAGATIGGITLTTYIPSVSLTNTVLDSNNAQNILVGEGCTSSVNGSIPAGLTNNAANPPTYKWVVSGNTIQNWASSDPNNPMSSLYNPGPGTLTNSTYHWYWSDAAGQKTVTCTVTLTPPIATDPVIKVAPVTTVVLNVPSTSEADAAGITRLDNQDTAFPSSYALWAGPTTSVKNGSQWNDSLTTPALFPPQPNDAGAWAHLQIITATGTATAAPGGTSKSLGTGVASLDGGFPYDKSGGYFPDNGTSEPEGDSPGVGLDDSYTEFSPSYTFDTYVMYAPPGADTVFVPITKLHWTWTVDVTKPNGGWESWPSGTSPGGTLTVPSAGTSWTTEPQWSNVVTGQH